MLAKHDNNNDDDDVVWYELIKADLNQRQLLHIGLCKDLWSD